MTTTTPPAIRCFVRSVVLESWFLDDYSAYSVLRKMLLFPLSAEKSLGEPADADVTVFSRRKWRWATPKPFIEGQAWQTQQDTPYRVIR
jgi:hypothetical protein